MKDIKNPIIPGFHPDPSVIKVEDTYYLANSTFEWFPGVEIHSSKDLINWQLLCRPLDNITLLDLRGIMNSGGVWAPCLSYDKGVFYLVYSIVRTFDEMTQDTDNYLTTAESLFGPWSEPVYLNSGGFDPSLFHDQDGSKWLLNMRWDSRLNENHFKGIAMEEYSAEKKKLMGNPKIIFPGTELGFTEAPHMYQRNEYYYLMTAEGGTSENHSITMGRSKNRMGPFEVDPCNPMLTTKDNPEYPIQYAGHGDIIEGKEGNWYLFHLASRKNMFGGYSVLGRETYLQNVYWNQDGWLRLADDSNLPKETVRIWEGDKETVREHHFYHRYNFSGEILDKHFSTLRIPLGEDMMSLKERKGYLRLKGRESILSKYHQSFVGLRIAEPKVTVTTSVDFSPETFGQMAGLTFYYNTANFYYLYISYEENKGRVLQLMKRDSRKTTLLLQEGVVLKEKGEVILRGDFNETEIRFYYQEKKQLQEGQDISPQWNPITPANNEKLPVYILSDEYANVCGEQGFTGSFVGLCCQDSTGRRTPADFSYLELSKGQIKV